jgi:catechol 2,3-dioxygenase-like lactoylglutathione lyase family enzyme
MANFHSIILDHLNIGVTDIDRSISFYQAALAPLGIQKFFDIDASRSESKQKIAGFGMENDSAKRRLRQRPVFWLIDKQPVGGQTHIAFAAASREQVDSFYLAAIEAGGIDNGQPGLRYYHPNYYGAFVLDPDGINVEAVCHS